MTALNAAIRDMIGDDAARDRLSDDSVEVGCAEGLWFVRRGEDEVAGGLTYGLAVEAVAALEA